MTSSGADGPPGLPPDLARPCVVMVAPNGARLGRADHPALPVSAEDVSADAEACLAAGATAIHLHARDAEGAHTLDPPIVRRYLDAVRARVGTKMTVQVTTEAVGRYTPAEQMALVREVRPPAVSLALRELLAAGEATLQTFLEFVVDAGIDAQMILYTPEEARSLEALRARRIVPAACASVLFVLGRYAVPGQATQPRDLLAFLAGHDPACAWSVCAFGRSETAALGAAAALGGDVRVGFENNRHHADGRLAGSNAERVAAVVALIRAMGRPIAPA